MGGESVTTLPPWPLDDLVDPFTTFDKNDKFDTLLVKKKIAYDTISQVKACTDYKACKNQMGEPFGFIPLSPLLVYTGPNTCNNRVFDPLLGDVSQSVQIFGLLYSSGF